MISPKVDPDLLPMVRHLERSECRREMHAYVGELPLLSDRFKINNYKSKLKIKKIKLAVKKIHY